jgi:hypothetical protein
LGIGASLGFLSYISYFVNRASPARNRLGSTTSWTGSKPPANSPTVSISRWKITSRGGSHAADPRAWEPRSASRFPSTEQTQSGEHHHSIAPGSSQ